MLIQLTGGSCAAIWASGGSATDVQLSGLQEEVLLESYNFVLNFGGPTEILK